MKFNSTLNIQKSFSLLGGISLLISGTVFANVISDRPGTGAFRNQDVTVGGTNLYDVTSNADQSFANGLRFTDLSATQSPGGVYLEENTQKFDFISNIDGEVEFSARAIVPSGQVVTGSQPDTFLMKPTEKNIPFEIDVQNVDGHGDLIADDFTTLIFDSNSNPVSPPVQFDPWIKLFLSDKPGNALPTNPLQFLFGELQRVYEYATTQSTKILPNAFKTFLSGIAPAGTTFVDEDLDQEGGLEKDFTGGGANAQEDSADTHLQATGGAIKDIAVAFTSRVQYDVNETDGTRTVLYPGGNLGNNVGGSTLFDLSAMQGAIGADNTDISGIIVGADIEGQVLTQGDNYSYQETGGVDDTRVLRMGNITVTDMREDITRNAYELIRSLPANEGSGTRDFDVTDFVDNKVTYFKGGTVRIGNGGTPESPRIIDDGRHTIVIEDGNLLVAGDMRYASVDDSFGVILINNQADVKPIIGNIFVLNNVKNFVGTYFSDGSLTSTINPSNPNILDGLDREDSDILGTQLLLEGTLLTRNTLGGGMLEPLISPWGAGTDRTEAQKYDLHFMRRYYPEYSVDPETGEQSQSNEDKCVITNGECDLNKHSFVVRPDGRVQNVTPPGFEQ